LPKWHNEKYNNKIHKVIQDKIRTKLSLLYPVRQKIAMNERSMAEKTARG